MLSIRAVDPQGPDAMALLHEAALDARALYPELIAADAPFPTNSLLPERASYVIAYVDGHPLACGALWPYEAAVGEIRRMYVHREHRRGGLARAVLAYLIGVAREFGYGRLILETGPRQSAAMRLYEAAGFRRIAPFGKHVDDPTSVCYELALSDA